MVLSDKQLRMALEFADRAWHAQDEEEWEIDAGQMLLACAEGNEIDVAALAVLLLMQWSLPTAGYAQWSWS